MTAVGSHTRDASISSKTDIALPATANVIRLLADTATVYYTFDGTTPSATNGFTLASGSEIMYFLQPGAIISVLSATGAIQYQCFGVVG